MSDSTRLRPQYSKSFRRPIRILSKRKLLEAWNQSRDSSSRPGAPGADGVRAKNFGENLEENITRLVFSIRDGTFGFSKLRARLLDRGPGKTDRVICIPTVRDRLVQRAIASHIYEKRILPIFNSSSYGFIPGTGVRDALRACVDLRESFDFVFETDIKSFFDTIDRGILVEKIQRRLRGNGLSPLLEKAVRMEIATKDAGEEERVKRAGIVRGVGLRQGMPLSPVLANFVLADFDRKIARAGFKMVRYADDIVVFAESLDKAKFCQDLIISELAKINHSIPDISENGKTRVAKRFEPFDFLGRTIVFSDKAGRYVQKVSRAKMAKISMRLRNEAKLPELISKGKKLPEVTQRLSMMVTSYLHSYSDAFNAMEFDRWIRREYEDVIGCMFTELFGRDVVSSLSSEQRAFLGIANAVGEYVESDDE